MAKKTVIFIDSGDTIIDEGKEVKDERGIVQTAAFIPGADEMLVRLMHEDYRIAMVADGYAESFKNIYNYLHMNAPFEQRIYSSDIGTEKPDRRMFVSAMRAMKLDDEDKPRIIMVGNNLERDVAGANAFGIASVLLDWSPRYCMIPKNKLETPDHIIHRPLELVELVHRLDAGRQ